MAVIKWQDPPAPQSGRKAVEDPSWAELREDLVQHPNQWALVEEDAPASVLSIYRNHCKKADGFQVRQSTKAFALTEGAQYKTARFDVYVRYNAE